jgi:hypothetical protein
VSAAAIGSGESGAVVVVGKEAGIVVGDAVVITVAGTSVGVAVTGACTLNVIMPINPSGSLK